MKATKATVEQRVEEILRLRLDGAEFWDIREYAREKAMEAGSLWQLAEGQKPLSDAQLWRYMGRADKMITEGFRASRRRLFRRHLAQRRRMYSKAMQDGDIKTALSVAQDEAALLNLYPPKRTEVSGKGGAALQVESVVLTDEQRLAALAAINARLGVASKGLHPGGQPDGAGPALVGLQPGDDQGASDTEPVAKRPSVFGRSPGPDPMHPPGG
jgi:hypothetical protein